MSPWTSNRAEVSDGSVSSILFGGSKFFKCFFENVNLEYS